MTLSRNSFQTVILDIDEFENIERNFRQMETHRQRRCTRLGYVASAGYLALPICRHSAYKDALRVLELMQSPLTHRKY